jgi:NAD(P)-dependent dehydrogenase (short-subunit alcohol dehydrogenase family)
VTADGGRVAVVTGASGAIGAAVADRLESDGFTVARTDVDGSSAFPCDVRDEEQVQRLRDDVRRGLGAPWLLVNVAGVFFEHDVPDLDVGNFDRIVDVNLKGTFLTCKTFLPAMLAAGDGCIVNVASTAGLRAGHRRAVYNASKAGVVLLSRCLALDHGPAGVRVNCVCPGLIDTPMADWIRLDGEALRRWEATVPAQRIGTVHDIAGAVSFLASADAAYLHGAAMVVDGGVTA